jgi:hypothetical protein
MGANLMSNELMLASFKGTYRSPHPEGFKEQAILRPFDVTVKMKQSFLAAPGLCGFFRNHYFAALKAKFPLMIAPYMIEFMGATELDGRPIDNPKAMSYGELLGYIQRKKYPINIGLYDATALRNEVVLYEQDPSGQQHLQGKLENLRGSEIALSNELAAIEDILVVNTSDRPEPGSKKVKSFAESLA